MRTYQIKCPNCDANLDINEDEGLDFIFCRYCGNKCAVDYGKMVKQINYTKKLKSDERKLDKRLSHEERVFAMKMKQEEKRRKAEEAAKDDKQFYRYMIGMGIFILIFMGFFHFTTSQDEKRDLEQAQAGNIKVDSNASTYIGENYEDIANILKGRGFTDVQCIKLNERPGTFDDPGEIKEIMINGNNNFNGGEYFSKDAPVRIYYYGE